MRIYIDTKNTYLIELIFYVIQKILSKMQIDLYAKKSNIFNNIYFFIEILLCKFKCNSIFDFSNFNIAFLTKIFAMSFIFVLISRYRND